VRAAICRLADFPDGAVFPDPELRASVRVPIGGAHSATAIVSLDPEGGFEWIRWLAGEQSVQGEGALRRFCSSAGTLARHALEGLGGGALEVGDPGLHEAPLVQTLLGTHAPPDTAVLSVEVAMASERGCLPLCFYVLMDAKILGGLTGALR